MTSGKAPQHNSWPCVSTMTAEAITHGVLGDASQVNLQGTVSPTQEVISSEQQIKQAAPVALASLLQLSTRLNGVLNERQYLVVKLVAENIAQEALGIARQVATSSLGRGLQVGA